MSNSIRVVEQQKGKGAAVTSVRQLFQKPTIKRKVVALIEGPDDLFDLLSEPPYCRHLVCYQWA